jgi:hypothetical protein
MIRVKKVWLNRAEGPTKLLTGPRTASSLEDADRIIKGWATSAPKDGGYDKVDFKVTWDDGEIYEGRYDMVYADSWKANIGDQIRRFLSFYGGAECPYHMEQDKYEKTVAMLERRSGIPREQYLEFMKGREIS